MNKNTRRAGLRTGQAPMVAVWDDRLLRRERIRVPIWASLLLLALRYTARMVWALLVLAVRRWPLTMTLLSCAWIWTRYGRTALAVTAALAVVLAAAVLTTWSRTWPASFSRWVGQPALGWWRWQRVYRSRWREAMHGCGLLTVRDGVEYVPTMTRIRSTRLGDVLLVRLAAGQTPPELARGAEGLRHVYGAYRATVREYAPGWCLVRFYVRDPLTRTLDPAPLPDVSGADLTGADALAVLRALDLGRCEDGTGWSLCLAGTHLLICGSTGAGKASVEWGIIRALAFLVRAGLVELWAVDPKGGMEFAFGRDLFARYEDDSPEAMIALLEDAADALDKRTKRLAGVTRSHVPSVGDPFIVVMVDEVADLTAHQTDTALKKRANAALSRMLAKGRAPGLAVVAAVVDPRKEVLPFRDLFPTRVALSLAEPDQADLVLGDGAREQGADCSAIPMHLPGVGYVRDPASPDPAPVRVRFAYISDEEIARLCHVYGRRARLDDLDLEGSTR